MNGDPRPAKPTGPNMRFSAFGAMRAWSPVSLLERPGVPLTALIFAASTPILTTRVAPLADYANHLARIDVIAEIRRDADLARIFNVEWAAIPNLIMDVIVPPLVRGVGIYNAGHLFLILIMALLATGPVAIQKALFGRISPWCLAVLPFLYNHMFLTGLVNYFFGMGVAMWALAGWIRFRSASAPKRLFALIPCCLFLFLCHLFALGMFGLGVLAVEIRGAVRGGTFDLRAFVRSCVVTGPAFLIALPLLAAGPTIGLSGQNYWETGGKLEGLETIFTTYGDLVDLPIALVFAAIVVWTARRGQLHLHPAGQILTVIGGLAYLAMPRMLFGSWYADHRLPIGLFFLLMGFIRLEASDPRSRRLVTAALIALALTRFVDVEAEWTRLDEVTEDLRLSTAFIDRGSAVLVAHADQPTGSVAEMDALSHAPCLAMIERSAAVSTAFTVRGKQILGVTPDFRNLIDAEDGEPPTVSQLLATAEDPVPGQEHYWDRWSERYAFLFILDTESDPNPDPDHLTLLHAGPRYQLYRVHPSEDDGDDDGTD